MRQYRTNSGEIVPDPDFIDQVREVVNEYWDTSSVIEYPDFVEVHMIDASFNKLRKKERVVEDLEEQGFKIDHHSGPWKVNVYLPEDFTEE